MRDISKRAQESFWLNFDPRVRGVARLLWESGFSPLAVFYEDDDEVPDERCVFLRCSPENMVAEAHRLHELVRSWRIDDYDLACSGDGPATCGMEAVYDPVKRDAYIILWGIENSMLPISVMMGRPAGRSRSKGSRSGGPGIAR